MKSKIIFVSTLLLCLVFLISSCKPAEVPVVYEYICGDGVCSANELGFCDIDCNLDIEQEPAITTPADVLEELRSRIRDYSPEERLVQINPYVEEDDKIFVESFTSYLPSKGFRVASRYNLLSIGENISDIIYVLNKFHLREILKSGRLSSNTEAFGPRAAMYEQFLKLRAGRVVFGLDENENVISTYLLFEEEQPILDYLMELNGGIFKFFEGEEIHFLGHDYLIEEVTLNSMRLIGLTTPDTILFRNNKGVWINDNIISNDVLNVTFEEDYLRIILIADDDINILPGTGLRGYFSRPEVMLTNRLDIIYEGLAEVPVFDIEFDKVRDKYKLIFITNKNMSYNIPLAYLNPFKIGSEKYSLVYKEGVNRDDYVIGEKDYFIINNNREFNGLTNILRLLSVGDNTLLFEDPGLEKFYVYYEGTLGVNASADLIIDNVLHKVYIGENETISVDLDGNGIISNDKVPIITAGNGIIRINNDDSDEISISFITPGEMRENTNSDLEINIIIDINGLSVDKDDIELIREKRADALVGMTDYGALLVLRKDVDSSEQRGQDLIIKHPIVQRFADVIVQGYE